MSAEETGSESEHFGEDIGSDEGDEAEDFVADAGIDVDANEGGTDSDEDEDTSTDEEEGEGDDDGSSRDAPDEGDEEDAQEILEETQGLPTNEIPTRRGESKVEQEKLENLSARSKTPAEARRLKFFPAVRQPRSYVVDAICALPHPVPTNAIAASLCMTHLLTGSDDGYIRDYDIFTACNGKNFLSAPQRQHCGFVEGVIKAGVLRSWWESALPQPPEKADTFIKESVYSLLVHSDSLWGLSGLVRGSINLFTIRHDPGKIIYTFVGHKGPVASMAMSPDERSFFSAGWDGEITRWDLNTGGMAERLPAQGAQLSVVALRPLNSPSTGALVSFGQSTAPQTSVPALVDNSFIVESIPNQPLAENFEFEEAPIVKTINNESVDVSNDPSQDNIDESKSDTSYDPLFDADPDADPVGQTTGLATDAISQQSSVEITQSKTAHSQKQTVNTKSEGLGIGGPFAQSTKVFDQSLSAVFSQDVMLTASIDGQILLWDRRSAYKQVGRLGLLDKCPPWCVSACWSADGAQIYAGRRNGTVDIWDIRQLGTRGGGVPRVLRTLRNPVSSGEVSCVAAFPDGKHIACASHDNIRLWNAYESEDTRTKGAQFKIITGHHGGQISQILIDPSARFMISASGNRGWFGESTRTVLVHDIRVTF